MELRIDARKVVGTLAFTAGVLLALHLAEAVLYFVLGHRRLFGLVGTFNMNYENNIPTFFSAFLLVACSALILAVSRRPDLGASDARHWRWLSLIFLLLALDEDAALHELWIEPLHYLFPLDGPFYFAWVIPYGIGLVIVGLVYLRFVLRLPAATRPLVLLAGGLYVSGAFGLEMVGGWYLSRHDETIDLAYTALVGAEESLEMAGALVLLHALFGYLKAGLGGRPAELSIH